MSKWRTFFLLFFLMACDDRKEGLQGFNDPPVILLKAERGGAETHELKDSVKLSNTRFAYMPFIIRISDPNENIKHVRMSMLTGTGELQFRDEVTKDTVRIVNNVGTYRFVPSAPGTAIIRFVVTDYFNATDSATLQLYCFNNLPPVAGVEDPKYLGAADKYEYLLSASTSYDADASFGGVVAKYIFSVNNAKIAASTLPAIPFIFPGPGQYLITVQVQDNDGAFSKPLSLQWTIPN